jgi:hypothetical protein
MNKVPPGLRFAVLCGMSSADVIRWKASGTLIATALVLEWAVASGETVLVRPARPTILDTLTGFRSFANSRANMVPHD